MVDFRTTDYGQTVQDLLTLGDNGLRPMALAPSGPSSAEARKRLKTLSASELFPASRSALGAMSGLYLYFSCLDESHTIAQDLNTPEGGFWHGIMHRQEPDAFNAGYWFRRVGSHPVFPALAAAAQELGYTTSNSVPPRWDPAAFIDYCETARKHPGSPEEKLAMQVQLAEWQLLFNYCATKAS